MPILRNAKHERFAQELAEGKSAGAAYVAAGYRPNRHNGAALARKQHILERVAELLAVREHIAAQSTAEAIRATGLTKEWILDALIENATVALGRKTVKTRIVPRGQAKVVELEVTDRDANAANRALELLGKHMALWIDRAEVGRPGDFDQMSEEELMSQIRESAKKLFGVDLMPDGINALVRGAQRSH